MEKRKKKSKISLFFKITAGLIVAVYFLIAVYYKINGFGANTWINGVYCAGKTVEEINVELLSTVKAPIIEITDPEGVTYEIDMSTMDFQADFSPTIQKLQAGQSPFFWIDNVIFSREHQVVPAVTYNTELLWEAFLGLEHVQKEINREEKYTIIMTEEEGYQLYDGFSRRLDVEKAFAALVETVGRGETSFTLDYETYYYDIEISDAQQETTELWEKLQKFYVCDIVYDMGDQMLTLSPKVLSQCLQAEYGVPVLDESGTFVLDEEGVAQFIADLAAEYDTYEKDREFQATRGETVTVPGVTYGTQINQEEEVAYLMENLLLLGFHTGRERVRVPVYVHEGFIRGKDDIGDTYIEVDMTEQKLYYYEAGSLVLETDIVTGNAKRNWDTPAGVNYVNAKQMNRTLRGEGYATPVKYWMPVKGNIGIHDAKWRDEFGGTIYQTNGSHGCINVPLEKMGELYEAVEIGTPVIMFY